MYNNWDGRVSYTERSIEYRDEDTPFTFDEFKKACRLNCDTGYWSNYDSQHNKSSNQLDQRCTSNNCKLFIYQDLSTEGSANYCTNCWAEADMAIYTQWDARASYSEFDVLYRDNTTPFKKDGDGNCILQCQANYWPNW
jgi:hypothetical protein